MKRLNTLKRPRKLTPTDKSGGKKTTVRLLDDHRAAMDRLGRELAYRHRRDICGWHLVQAATSIVFGVEPTDGTVQTIMGDLRGNIR